MDRIICGGFEWVRDAARSNDRIDGGVITLENSIACDALSVDTMDVEIYSECLLPQIFYTSDGTILTAADTNLFCVKSGMDIRKIPYGAPVEYYRGAVLFAKMHKEAILRTGKALFTLKAISPIGLLENLPHPGGIYCGTTASAVFADILGNSAVYSVAQEVAPVQVWGWLPYDTKRKNLHKLLFALGASIKKNKDGTMRFSFLDSSESSKILADNIFDGGSVAYGGPATGVDVAEHAYSAFPSDKETTLFDNSDGSGAVSAKVVTFSRPCHDLVSTPGLTINISGVNFAKVTGTGVLTGKEYTHQTKIFSLRRQNVESDNKIVAVDDCTLVSIANVENVAKRALAYYGAAEEVAADIVVGMERPGDSVEFSDPFGENSNGLIKAMNIGISNLLRASTTIIRNYVPIGSGNYYNNYVVLTADTPWLVPDGVTKIHAVVIQGGQGGQSGANGEDSPQPTKEIGSKTFDNGTRYWTVSEFGLGGKGGIPGSGGVAGKVLRVDIDVTPGQIIPATIGAGGAGGAYNAGAQTNGAYGTDSTFGAFSSSTGAIPTGGFKDIFSGATYAVSGAHGIHGGSGTGWSGNKENYDEIADGAPVKDPDGTVRTPGTTIGTRYEDQDGGYFSYNGIFYQGNVSGTYYPGRGGGAAAGANGNPSANTDGGFHLHFGGYSVLDIYVFSTSSRGGNGANALLSALAQNAIGSGGHGGHGGGGAGGTGVVAAHIWDASGNVKSAAIGFSALPCYNLGGAGTSGGNGAPGGVIIYY